MNMFNESFVRSLKSFGIFLLLYTIIFALFFWISAYTFPFVFAFTIALMIQPITRFFKEKLKLTRNIPSLLSSFLVYLVSFVLLALLFYKIMAEAKLLLISLPNAKLDIILNPIRDLINGIGLYFKDIDPTFIEKNSSQISSIVTNGLNILGKSLNTLLSIAISIPVWITILFIVILSTYFFSRDMSVIKEKISYMLSDNGKEKFVKVWYEGIKMLTRYVKAYSIIYFLTFLQTLVGFSIFRVKYAVILSIICAAADVLPVLGIGLIYIPLAAIYLISGNYFTAIGIIILYLIINIVRRIVEPKIVSTSLGIHPIIVLAVIFIGFTAYGFIGMIYLTFLVLFYKVLKTVKIL